MDRQTILGEIVEQFQQLKTDLRFVEFIDPCYDSGFNPTDRDFDDAVSLNEALQDFSPEVLAALAESLCQLLMQSPDHEERNKERNRERNVLEALDEAATLNAGTLSIKEFVAALAFCILTGLKARANNGLAARGGIAAAVFLLLCTATHGNVPARLHQTLGLTSFYIKHLFAKSIDILSLPELWDTQKFVGGRKGSKGRAPLQRTLLDVDEEAELVVQTGVQWEESECLILKALVLFARNVDLDAFPYHLARPCRAVAGVWKRGFENFQPTLDDTLDVGEVLKRNTRKELVGKFFSLVLSEAQKNHTENLEVILWTFEPGLLRLNDTLGTYPTAPPKKVHEYSVNVATFCLRIVEKFSDDVDCDDVFERFMHDVFSNTPDMAEYRRYTAKIFVKFLSVLKPALRQNLIQWIAEESDADRARGRALALYVAQEMWTKEWNHVEVPYLKCNSLKSAILTMCIRRLRDKSSKIRGCAASVMSSLLESDGSVFDHLRVDEEAHVKDQQSIQTLFSTVLAGISDVSVVSRKAYLLMVGRLLVSDFRLFDIEVKEAILRVAQDPAKSMRTSNIDVICDIAQAQVNSVEQENTIIEAVCDLWLRGVFHCYMDPEQTIKSRVIEAFVSTILNPLLTSDAKDNVLARSLLDKICKDELGEIRLLRQIFHDMEKSKTLTTTAYNKFREYLDGPDKQTTWIVLAELSAILPKCETEFAFAYLDNLSFEGEDDPWGASLFRLIQAGFKSKALKTNVVERLQELKEYFPNIRGVATVVEAVRAIAAGFEALGTKQQHGKHDDFADWADEYLQDCTRQLREQLASYGDWLNHHRLAPKEADAREEATPQETDICFCVRLISELGCHLGLGKPKNRSAKAVVGDESPESLIERVCDFESALQCRSWVRAHGVFALGRLCLGVKQLSWKYAPKIVSMANTHSNDIGLRRDAIVVVFDLLKMFGDVVEKDLFKVYGWLGDPNSTIRGDVISHLHNLLLNEHLQWNPAVFYQFLTSISDPNPKIREWVRSCLRSLMKKRNQCFSDFSEAIIFLNACHSHPRFKVAAKLNNQGVEFALVGNDFADKRLEIYSFMLRQMLDDQKRITYGRILEQILMPVVTRDIKVEADAAYRNVLMDVFRILGLKEMQFSVFIKNTDEEEELEEPEENVEADQIEEENQRKAEKQNKAQRKELWIKFRQEIVQRTLLPVLSSVYRQIKYMQDDQELLQAEIRLVDYLAKSAEINLAELAQSTSGADGQVLKSLAMDIQRLEEQTRASVPPTPSAPSTPQSRADDVPLVSSQVTTSDVQTPMTTPLPANAAAKKAKSKDESVESTLSETSEEPSSRKRATKAPAAKANKTKKVLEESQPEVKAEEVTKLPPRQSRRIKDKSDLSMPFSERNTENGKRRSTSPADESNSAPPPKKKNNNTRRGTKILGKSTVIKKEEMQSSPEAVAPRRTTRLTAAQQAPVEEESFGEGDDTIVDLQNASRRRTTALRNGDKTMSRGVSTPIKSKNGNMGDVTFGADISVIDPSEVTHRTIKSNTKSKAGKNRVFS